MEAVHPTTCVPSYVYARVSSKAFANTGAYQVGQRVAQKLFLRLAHNSSRSDLLQELSDSGTQYPFGLTRERRLFGACCVLLVGRTYKRQGIDDVYVRDTNGMERCRLKTCRAVLAVFHNRSL